MLRQFSKEYGYTVDVIEKERYGDMVISSTYIRDALAQGDVKLAERLLGYPYEITGIVQHGKQLGRTLGFPTMNIEPEENKILPTVRRVCMPGKDRRKVVWRRRKCGYQTYGDR